MHALDDFSETYWLESEIWENNPFFLVSVGRGYSIFVLITNKTNTNKNKRNETKQTKLKTKEVKMANDNPNTSGLISLADRPNNERTTIAEQGGIASGKKRKEIKRLADIVYGIRKGCENDPVVDVVKSLFDSLQNTDTKTTDILRILNFIKDVEPEFHPEPPRSSVREVIALRNYMEALGDKNMPQEEKDKRAAELSKYMDVDI